MGQVGFLISSLLLLLASLTPKAWSKLIEANYDSFNAQSSTFAVSLAVFCLVSVLLDKTELNLDQLIWNLCRLLVELVSLQ